MAAPPTALMMPSSPGGVAPDEAAVASRVHLAAAGCELDIPHPGRHGLEHEFALLDGGGADDDSCDLFEKSEAKSVPEQTRCTADHKRKRNNIHVRLGRPWWNKL